MHSSGDGNVNIWWVLVGGGACSVYHTLVNNDSSIIMFSCFVFLWLQIFASNSLVPYMMGVGADPEMKITEVCKIGGSQFIQNFYYHLMEGSRPERNRQIGQLPTAPFTPWRWELLCLLFLNVLTERLEQLRVREKKEERKWWRIFSWCQTVQNTGGTSERETRRQKARLKVWMPSDQPLECAGLAACPAAPCTLQPSELC